MFDKVLAATDMLPRSDPALQTAIKIAQQKKGELYLLHVLEKSPLTYPKDGGSDENGIEITGEADRQEHIKRDVERRLADAYISCRKYEIKLATGLPWDEIVKLAREIEAHLIVLGPHAEGDEHEAGRAIGSTIEGVVRREPCPVMIVNRLMPGEKLDFKKVIVCVDFSNSCSHALKYATKIAQERHSNLFIFHMLPIPPSTQYSQAHYRRDLEAAGQKLREFCRVVANQIDLEYEMWGGAIPHVEILTYARRCEADLIVMGSHTKERRGKWYVGSAVERVSCRSLCPVVVVSDPKALLN
jgi:nucleotide-binding universal stress UspA family protein